MVQQAIQRGALPRLHVLQTSDEAEGQVYVPPVDWLLAIAVLGLVVGFCSSDALASAHGMAVAGDMLVTKMLVAIAAHRLWTWSLLVVAPVMGFFLLLDLTFVSANVHKIPSGGWFPLTVGAVLLTMMLCWRRGRTMALEKRGERAIVLKDFLTLLQSDRAPSRVPGTAIYLTQSNDYVPEALALNLRHNGVVHEQVVLLKVATERVPRVPESTRVKVVPLAAGFGRIEMLFGFAGKPDVPAALAARRDVLGFDPASSSYFLGHETPVPSFRPEIPRWQERVYAFLTHNAVRAPDY
jgi:KUP system potassium uptake protein